MGQGRGKRYCERCLDILRTWEGSRMKDSFERGGQRNPHWLEASFEAENCYLRFEFVGRAAAINYSTRATTYTLNGHDLVEHI